MTDKDVVCLRTYGLSSGRLLVDYRKFKPISLDKKSESQPTCLEFSISHLHEGKYEVFSMYEKDIKELVTFLTGALATNGSGD